MIVGRFGNTTGRPYFEGRLIFPNLKLRCDISFILDTGADRTVLMPMDGIRIGIDYTKLSTTVTTFGIGGRSKDFVEPALACFAGDDGSLYVYSIDCNVATPIPDIMNIPSLLGRDVFCDWRMIYDQTAKSLLAEALRADLVIPPGAPGL